MNLVDRVKNILLQPKAEWETISNETTPTAELYKGYIMPLAAIGPVASVIGLSLVGISLPFGGTVRMSIATAITQGIIGFVLSMAAVYVVALIIDALAPNFGGEKNMAQALKVAAYSSTPSWVAGILMLVPALGTLALIAALYGLYLLYLGLPTLMKAPQDKALGYAALVVVGAIVVGIVVGAINSIFIPHPGSMMGAGFGPH